ncbi:MAG: type II toxin-antitoxin system VapB family antitoxin [Pseudorhizobium sp.]
MSLYIRDSRVNKLADQVMRQLGTKTKTEAVRLALERVLEQASEELSMEERIRLIQDRVAADMGPHRVPFDEKAYMDEMWED